MCMYRNRELSNDSLAGGLIPGALHSIAVLLSEAALGKPCCLWRLLAGGGALWLIYHATVELLAQKAF
jgi:hypothetical protein